MTRSAVRLAVDCLSDLQGPFRLGDTWAFAQLMEGPPWGTGMFYCRKCRFELGYSRALPGPILNTNYQRAKHAKHTVVSTSEELQSIFANPSTTAIREHVERALLAGPMEIDGCNRINFYSTGLDGRPTGYRYEWGILVNSQDATRVVLSTSPDRYHAFPDSTLNDPLCARCGEKIFS